MKRLCALMVLMLTASSAQAGTISFSVGGHRIRIEAPRDCRSSSCASVSVSGVYQSRSKRDDDTRDDTRNVVTSPPPPAPPPVQAAPPPAPAPVQQSVPSAPKPIVASAPQPAPLAVYRPAAATTQEVAPPPLPPLPPVPQVQPATVTQPCSMPPADRADDSVRPTRPVLKVLHEEEPADSPIGDWQTEGKGMVRIAECGRALCGYAIREGEDEKGEAILINMKSKSDERWSGSVYSKDSGDTYYGTMRLRGPNTLHVEACAFSRFYCNGNNWTRITRPERMMTSRQTTPEPRS